MAYGMKPLGKQRTISGLSISPIASRTSATAIFENFMTKPNGKVVQEGQRFVRIAATLIAASLTPGQKVSKFAFSLVVHLNLEFHWLQSFAALPRASRSPSVFSQVMKLKVDVPSCRRNRPADNWTYAQTEQIYYSLQLYLSTGRVLCVIALTILTQRLTPVESSTRHPRDEFHTTDKHTYEDVKTRHVMTLYLVSNAIPPQICRFVIPPSPSDTVSNTPPLQSQNLMWI